METQKLYELIGLQSEMIERMRSVGEEIDLQQVEPCLEQMMDGEKAAEAYRQLAALWAEDTDCIRLLYCQLECARRVHARYCQMGIGQRVYVDTMKCFTRFIKECEKKNGRMFFDRSWWSYRQISMSLFRIGTLEYEFAKQEEENVIAVHIPSDADLSKDAVDRSQEEAGRFFRTYYPDYRYDKYICDSWLLSPVLQQLLPETSNIIAFQKRFARIGVNQEAEDCIEWLFQVPDDTEYRALSEATSLQRKAKALLLAGGHIGTACGVMKDF